jgi:nucleotide-binding universal stress UspA family protein
MWVMTTFTPKHILVPHDFSDTAERATSLALDVAEKMGARVTLLHVYDMSYGFPEGAALSVQMAKEFETAARNALDGVASRTRRQGVETMSLLRQGVPWKVIVDVAKEAKVDLIVMGTQGRRGLARWMLGSTAERVVRTSPCPVLTVHGPDGSKQDPA